MRAAASLGFCPLIVCTSVRGAKGCNETLQRDAGLPGTMFSLAELFSNVQLNRRRLCRFESPQKEQATVLFVNGRSFDYELKSCERRF